MRVVVGGGAGFVGSHLCRRLVADGHTVTCIDNLSTGALSNVADLLALPSFAFIEQDVERAPDLEADLIYHLASPASPIDYQARPLETLSANSRGTWRLLDMARSAGARLVYASTSEIYGDPLVHPQPETYWGNVDPVSPRACYDEGKRFGEALVTSYRRVHRVPAAIVRIFNTYGPQMRAHDGRVIPELLGAALEGRDLPVHGDGSQTRSFMYVSDLVEGLVRVGYDPAADGEILNIGSPAELTILELAEEIRRLFAPDARIALTPSRPSDPQRRRPDISRMRARYGWEPEISLDEGLRKTADWSRLAAAAGALPADSRLANTAGGASGAR